MFTHRAPTLNALPKCQGWLSIAVWLVAYNYISPDRIVNPQNDTFLLWRVQWLSVAANVPGLHSDKVAEALVQGVLLVYSGPFDYIIRS